MPLKWSPTLLVRRRGDGDPASGCAVGAAPSSSGWRDASVCIACTQRSREAALSASRESVRAAVLMLAVTEEEESCSTETTTNEEDVERATAVDEMEELAVALARLAREEDGAEPQDGGWWSEA